MRTDLAKPSHLRDHPARCQVLCASPTTCSFSDEQSVQYISSDTGAAAMGQLKGHDAKFIKYFGMGQGPKHHVLDARGETIRKYAEEAMKEIRESETASTAGKIEEVHLPDENEEKRIAALAKARTMIANKKEKAMTPLKMKAVREAELQEEAHLAGNPTEKAPTKKKKRNTRVVH